MIMMMMMNDGDDVGGNEDGWPAPFMAGNVLRGLCMITRNTKPQMFKRRRS
jgi:hypothetical protein